jgi:MbtH protein
MANPFEDADAEYAVLINDEGQYSLWPLFADVPAGWSTVLQGVSREECVKYIDENWTDMRPLSLQRAMDGADSQ